MVCVITVVKILWTHAAQSTAELQSFGGKACTLAFAMVGLLKKPFGKAKALEFEKKKGIA